MDHGTQAYFQERARFARRASLLTLAVSLALLAPILLVLLDPDLGRATRSAFMDTRRFGFEGPEQFVRRIELEALGDGPGRAPRTSMPPVVTRETRRGGSPTRPAADADRFSDVSRSGPPGPGDSDEDLMARALLRAGGTPVFRSEDLVITHLVRPAYPEEAQDEGLEGRVVLMALIDTLGRVSAVDLMSGEPGGMLEVAAEQAVLQCRFRPYRVGEETRSVYAVFRFVFRLY